MWFYVKLHVVVHLFHCRLLCFVIQAPSFHVLRNEIQLVENIESQAASFFSKMLVDRSSFLCTKTSVYVEKCLSVAEIQLLVNNLF